VNLALRVIYFTTPACSSSRRTQRNERADGDRLLDVLEADVAKVLVPDTNGRPSSFPPQVIRFIQTWRREQIDANARRSSVTRGRGWPCAASPTGRDDDGAPCADSLSLQNAVARARNGSLAATFRGTWWSTAESFVVSREPVLSAPSMKRTRNPAPSQLNQLALIRLGMS
jgi:hypothetical protein